MVSRTEEYALRAAVWHLPVGCAARRDGGFRLAAPPGEVVLASVVAPFEPQVQRTRCLLGLPECSNANPCGAHDKWRAIKEATIQFLEGTTLADVLENGDPDALHC